MTEEAKTFMIEDARIAFRNFSGKEDQYNREGNRNFLAILDEETAQRMLADGWAVKWFNAKENDPDYVPEPFIQVSVSWKNRPPRVVMLSSAGRTNLGESDVEVLDWVDFETVDLICRGYDWVVNGKSGTKAYLKSLFVTIAEDELERKYAVAGRAKTNGNPNPERRDIDEEMGRG